jgi:hypothetical protein
MSKYFSIVFKGLLNFSKVYFRCRGFMKIKPVTYMVLACAFAMAACTPVSESYWQPVDQDSASLSRAQTDALLNKNLAACNAGIAELDKNAAPSDSNLDDCMQGEGWKRQGVAPPNPQWLKAASDQHQYTPPIAQQVMGQVDGDKQQIATDIRNDELVPLGGKTTIGIQGYQDHYNESAPNVNIHTNYYGGVAGYTYRNDKHNFVTVDGRLARGEESYESPSGVLDGIPEYEGEARVTVGHDYAVYGDGWISPYLGIGGRLYRDGGKGTVTNLGAHGYDRRIDQIYAPIGATWRTLLPGSITMADTFEVDPLLIGNVNSRLQNDGGPNVVNTQSLFTGYGIFAEAMFGIPVGDTLVEAGPFFRYWNISDSTFNIQSCSGMTCTVDFEPYNRRTQVGLTTRVTF